MPENQLLNSVGVTNTPTHGFIQVGTSDDGSGVYSNPQLSNSSDTEAGRKVTNSGGIALGAMGAFENHAGTGNFMAIGDSASNPEFIKQLDDHKTNQNPSGFWSTLSNMPGSSISPSKIKESTQTLYNNWGSLSPAQKSLSVAGVGAQGFVFPDGKTLQDKTITPEIPGAPTLTASHGLQLAAAGVNVAPLAKNWPQLTALQDTLFPPDHAGDVAETANNLGLLGQGIDGASSPITKGQFQENGMVPAPHFGVGAALIPQGQPIPASYTALKVVGGNNVVIPKGNQDSSLINAPAVASNASYQLYKNWPHDPKTTLQTKGVLGGSALVGGLSAMSQSNPYTLGALMTHSTYENTGAPDTVSNNDHALNMIGVTLARLVDGKVDATTDKKGLEHARLL